MLLISVLEGKGFCDLIAFLEPDFTVPCCQTMTVRLEKMNSEAAASLHEILSLAEKVAITMTFTFLLTGLCRVRSYRPAQCQTCIPPHCGIRG